MAKKTKYSHLSREQIEAKLEKLERERYGLVWEDKEEDVAKQCETELPVLKEDTTREIASDTEKPYNFIIEGDNYHSLYTLNFTHKKKIDVIYIDPPYNTGNKSWKYNNNYVDNDDPYRHSKWLSFMNKRLRLAKNLLKKNGVLICAIDKNEQHQLGMLLDNVFKTYESHCITIVHNPRGTQGKNFSYTHESAFFVFPQGEKVVGDRKLNNDEIDWSNFRNWGAESLRTDAKNCFYPVIVNSTTLEIIDFGDVTDSDIYINQRVVKKDNLLYIYPVDNDGIERKWRYARQSVDKVKHLLRCKKSRNDYDIQIGKDFGIYKTIWIDKRYDANEYGTKLLKTILPDCDFNFPKSINTVYDCLYAVCGTNKNALILDFFAGSGTTAHAVLELNKEDGGNRQFILCTNNENNICEEVTYPRIKKVIEGYADKEGIPANVKYFKQTFVPNILSDKGKRELVNRSTELLCMAENTFENVVKRSVKSEFAIFKNATQQTAIIYDEESIEKCVNKLNTINSSLETVIYVFSYDHTYDEESFENLKIKFSVKPIPEAILNIYRKIAKMSKK